MTSAGWIEEQKKMLWTEAASSATKLDNMINEQGESSPFRKFYKEDPGYEKHLRVFGEIGVVTSNPDGTIGNKLKDRGIECIFLGYAANHAGNVY